MTTITACHLRRPVASPSASAPAAALSVWSLLGGDVFLDRTIELWRRFAAVCHIAPILAKRRLRKFALLPGSGLVLKLRSAARFDRWRFARSWSGLDGRAEYLLPQTDRRSCFDWLIALFVLIPLLTLAAPFARLLLGPQVTWFAPFASLALAALWALSMLSASLALFAMPRRSAAARLSGLLPRRFRVGVVLFA